METILTKEEVMKKYDYKNTTFYQRRNECLLSEFSDAIILDGLRHTLIKAPLARIYRKPKRKEKTRINGHGMKWRM
ncbi:hypothetical protein [Lactobacillus apis]|uniref:hypothetical protein n=1 Tax=Lactobacillus apis TaxID=303541 RepID=UPI00242C18B2|nr:hypothetical protein [Lactobacillus apis]